MTEKRLEWKLNYSSSSMKMMNITKTISLLFIILKSTKCSLVFDTISQNEAHINKYCQETEYCLEGTHVMCRQYDHNQNMGPRCKDMFQNDYDKENEMISIFNDIRGRIATGRMLTLDGKPFPRAYGMMRLKVDPELTLFAKTMSHGCFRRFQEENCANTDIFTSTALVYSELKQSAYEKNVTGAMNLLRDQMLANIPAEWLNDGIRDIVDVRDEKYKVILQGAVRHVGCAMRLMRTDYEPNNYYNGVLCYFANVHWPIHQKPYITERPSPDKGFSEECGCPIGYKETENCLCDAQEQYLWLRAGQYPPTKPPPTLKLTRTSTAARTYRISTDRMGYTGSNILILPIFSINIKKRHKTNNTKFFKELHTEQVTMHHAKDQHKYDLLEGTRTYTVKHSAKEMLYSKVPSALKKKPKDKNITLQRSNDKKHVVPTATFGRQYTKKKEAKILKTELSSPETNFVHRQQNNVDTTHIWQETGFDYFMNIFHNLERKAKNHVKKNKKETFVTNMGKLQPTVFDKQRQRPFTVKYTPAQPVDIDNEFTELKNYLQQKSNL